jgi:tRNA nucleotidyltransferase (CCA-adding enzyme)
MVFEFTSDNGLEYVITVHFYEMPKEYYLTDENISDQDKIFIDKELPKNFINLYVAYTTKEEHEKLDKAAAKGNILGKKGGTEDNFPTVNTGEPLKILSTVSLALKSAYKKALEFFGAVNVISYLPKADKTGDERRARINQIFVEKGLQKNNIPIRKRLRSAGTIIYVIDNKEPNVATQEANESYINSMNEEILKLEELPFKNELESIGGKIYSVGGAVRDEFLGKPSKDLDIVVTGIPEETLINRLQKYGKAGKHGKKFGVIQFKPTGSDPTEEAIDVALPRTEVSTGAGHKNFEVTLDHTLPIEKDLERRDFTINAMAKDTKGNLIDPFNGLQDLKDKKIRMTYPNSFVDDELRMLRAVQFASRFEGFEIEPETYAQIKKAASTIKEVSPERWLEEFRKIVEKGDAFKGAILLKDTGLMREIFGKEGGLLTSPVWDNIKTMGEFIYMISHNLVDDPAEFYKTNLKGDTDTVKEIKALTFLEEVQNDRRLNRGLVNQILKLAPQVLKSALVPNELKSAIQDLMSGRYPKNVGDLAINGNDLVSLNVPPKERGIVFSKIMSYIYADKLKNERNELLKFVENWLLSKNK